MIFSSEYRKAMQKCIRLKSAQSGVGHHLNNGAIKSQPQSTVMQNNFVPHWNFLNMYCCAWTLWDNFVWKWQIITNTKPFWQKTWIFFVKPMFFPVKTKKSHKEFLQRNVSIFAVMLHRKMGDTLNMMFYLKILFL